MIKYDYNIPLYELFNLQPEKYDDISVLSLPFSTRVINRLSYFNINTMHNLLLVDIAFLYRIQGLGANSIQQVLLYCEELSKKEDNFDNEKRKVVSDVFFENRDYIADGDFSFVDGLSLDEDQEIALTSFREAYSTIGNELANDCIWLPEKIFPVISALSDFCTNFNWRKKFKKIYYQIPKTRRKNKAKYYIDAFPCEEKTREELYKCYSSNDELGSIIYSLNTESVAKEFLVKKFLTWCSFDLGAEVDQIFSEVYSSPRIQSVIEGRAQNITLNDLGEQLGITRERVRQIEFKAKNKFFLKIGNQKIIPKIIADHNGKTIITISDIETICTNNTAAFVFLLKELKGDAFRYDRYLDAFVCGNDDLASRIQDYIDTLPDVIHKKDIASIFDTAENEYNLDIEYVEKAFYEVYRITGDIYHRTRLSLSKIYDIVIRKYFQSGIHIYDDNEINTLRQHINEDYGDINLPSSNRAIGSRISDVCILAGRGTYIAKKDHLISAELAQKILSFIINSSSPILFIGNIFSIFEEDLYREGIENRFYLQGVLRELFGDKLFFRRDYVSKDKGITSIYSTIVSYIKSSKYPVKKEELKRKFIGITDIVFTLATSDSEILNYFGEYLHGSNLVIRENEKEYLSDYLAKITSDGEAHHIKDIYSSVNKERPEIFRRNAAIWPYSAFSVLEYLFREEYQFERPYVAKKGVEIGSSNERLHEFLYSKDEFAVSDITEFVKENRMHIISLIEYINSINDNYLLVSCDTIVSITEIGVNNSIASFIESCICNEITETTSIRNLLCISQFPTLNYSWDEWLIYSIINKWSNKLEVALSSSQFKKSIPLVSPVGKMDKSKFKDASPVPTHIKIDNMDDIDDLLADIISDELLEDIE